MKLPGTHHIHLLKLTRKSKRYLNGFICGGGDTALASKAISVAVWAFHGKNDKNVPVSGSRDMINAMKNSGGHPRYTEFPDEAHNIWYKTSITPGLWDWLFSQKAVN